MGAYYSAQLVFYVELYIVNNVNCRLIGIDIIWINMGFILFQNISIHFFLLR